jgi:hypothetical protein
MISFPAYDPPAKRPSFALLVSFYLATPFLVLFIFGYLGWLALSSTEQQP